MDLIVAAFYDPSLQLIFFDQNSDVSPDTTPAVSAQVAATNDALAIALGVSMPLVVIIAAIFVILVIRRKKNRTSAEFARVQQKLHNSVAGTRTSAVEPTPEQQPENPPKSSASTWKRASTKIDTLKNIETH